MQEIYKTIGLLRSNWFDRSGNLITINYGTAFAVTDRIVMTCTHNIYSDKRKGFASEVIFYPNIFAQRISKSTKSYKSISGPFYKSIAPETVINQRPVKEQLSLIVLEESIEADKFMEVGSIQNQEQDNQMRVIGFPSANYLSTINLFSVYLKRKESKGSFYISENKVDFIIDYTMETGVGMSGSPVMIQKQEGDFKIVGIHTHRGLTSSYNSGLYFNDEIIERIKVWVKQIETENDLTPMNIFCGGWNDNDNETCASGINGNENKDNSEILRVMNQEFLKPQVNKFSQIMLDTQIDGRKNSQDIDEFSEQYYEEMNEDYEKNYHIIVLGADYSNNNVCLESCIFQCISEVDNKKDYNLVEQSRCYQKIIILGENYLIHGQIIDVDSLRILIGQDVNSSFPLIFITVYYLSIFQY